MKGYPQYLWFVVLALLLVCTGCSNEGETVIGYWFYLMKPLLLMM